MPQAYNLDFETMLSILSRRQLSGSLVADVPRGRVGREPAHIEISVNSGKVVFCSLRSGQTYITGEDALRVITQFDVIPWIFAASLEQGTVQPTHLVQPAPPARQLVPIGEVSRLRIPVRSSVLQQTDLARLPRSHFQVYAYVDGRRTVEEIAQQLRTTIGQVQRVLDDLQTWRIVHYK